jgi:hypothetical protein
VPRRCPQGGTANLPCIGSYSKAAYEGEGTVDGRSCSLWGVHENKPPKTVEDIVFCVDKGGALLSVNLTFHGQQTLRYGNPPTDHTFNVSTMCVALALTLARRNAQTMGGELT